MRERCKTTPRAWAIIGSEQLPQVGGKGEGPRSRHSPLLAL